MGFITLKDIRVIVSAHANSRHVIDERARSVLKQTVIGNNKFLLKHLVIKTSDKKYERRFDRSTVILKFKFMK